MNSVQIDANMLQKAFLTGAQSLEAKKEWINELNVFPVPDGDTGTNMTMTIMSAAKEVAAIEDPDMESVCKAISSGSLRGARGNSGVILSQLFRGFTKVIKTSETIDINLLSAALTKATETAYKAVMKPKEGTILTVAKGISDKAAELAPNSEDIIEFITAVIEYGDVVLAKTPDMLPVLKQAGVVDSGGQGLMQVLKGALDGLTGKEVDYTEFSYDKTSSSTKSSGPDTSNIDTADIKFGYCTEFIINAEKEFTDNDETSFKSYLESIGDSIVCVADDDIIKVHVHTNDPGLAIQRALTYGSLSRMKIDNMREEHHERLRKEMEKEIKEKVPNKPYGFISVAAGSGLDEIFKGIGADYLIEGGQTMNPSTEDMLNAIEKVHADTIFILPNNKNIILAAEQAAKLSKDKKIIVIPSKTVPQGITALINFIPDQDLQSNIDVMTEEMGKVKTAQVTYAVRDTNLDGYGIHQGDIMAIGDAGIMAVSTSIDKTVIDALSEMVDGDSELISIYYGADIEAADAENIYAKAKETFPDAEIELHEGDQPVYYYLLSVE